MTDSPIAKASDRSLVLGAFLSKCNKKGEGKLAKEYAYVGMADLMRPLNIPRIPSGSLIFDFASGGGLPRGRMIEFYGPKSSGKTSTSLHVIAENQDRCTNCGRFPKNFGVESRPILNSDGEEDPDHREYYAVGECDCAKAGLYTPERVYGESEAAFDRRVGELRENSYEEFRVAFLDQEGTFDRKYARSMGIDDRRLLYANAESAEEMTNIYEGLLRTGALDLFVLDSIATMVPGAEIEGSAEDKFVGLHARAINSLVRKITAAMTFVDKDLHRNPTHIWINQVREKVGDNGWGNGPKETVTGGRGQGFMSSVEVKFYINELRSAVQDFGLAKTDAIETVDKARVNFIFEKNKTGPPRVKGSYVMDVNDHPGQIDEDNTIIALCENYGYIDKRGSKWVLGEKDEFGTKKELVEFMFGSRDSREKIKRDLLKRMLIKGE